MFLATSRTQSDEQRLEALCGAGRLSVGGWTTEEPRFLSRLAFKTRYKVQPTSNSVGIVKDFLPRVRQNEREAVHSPQYSTELDIKYICAFLKVAYDSACSP